MMNFIQNLLDGSTIPVISALLLGVVTAISPCPLATNITAIGYISKDICSRHKVLLNGLLYMLGRILSYTVLGIVLIEIIKKGLSMFRIQSVLSEWGGKVLAIAMILIGLFMLFGKYLPNIQFTSSQKEQKFKFRGLFGAFALGVLFALAFCPTSGILFFGGLLPMAAVTRGGAFLPLIFAIGTSIPVLIVAFVLAYGVKGVGKFYGNVQLFQKWMKIVVGIAFLLIGLYYFVIMIK